MTVLSRALAAFARDTIHEPRPLEQRAELLDAIWADYRNPSRSVLRTMLPNALLPACAPEPARLREYAADLVWTADGACRVSRDHLGDHPGAALLGMPVLAVFLPSLCRALLGQSLLLASLPAWWLADRETLTMLAARPQRFQLADAVDPRREPIALRDLPPQRRRDLQAKVEQAPDRFVAKLADASGTAQTVRLTAAIAISD